jgi:hypothetical protein
MKTTLSIPTKPEELTAAWLTAALRAGGVIPGAAAVTSASYEVLGQGAGFIGQIARVTLAYDRPIAGAPGTLIAKMPALDPGARELAGIYGLYEREYRFYRELADEITFRTARCYYSDGDTEKVEYVLLLEDFGATGRAGDQVKGCTAEEARIAMAHLALHHARWWQHPRLTQIEWLPPGVDLVKGAMEQSYPQAWQKTLEIFPDHITGEIRDVMPTLGPRITRLLEALSDRPMTMGHGDYRLDNMFFGNAGSGYEVAVLDWQSPNMAWGAYDVAYFLYSNVDTETRRNHEMDVLREYHRTLVANGVTGYEWEQLVEDYRASLLVSLGIWIVNAATLDMANERGKALFDLFFDRLNAAITDLNALELLPA